MKAFTTQDYEFYPTPAALANKMWDKFKDKDYTGSESRQRDQAI